MSKNLIPQIAAMLGLQLGEEFKVKGYDELTYRFAGDGLKLTHYSGIAISEISANVAFINLVNGTDEIIKLPWKPKVGEEYWTFVLCGVKTWGVINYVWSNSPSRMAVLQAGWVYKTCAEAEAALPKVAAEMGVDYEL